MSAITTASAEKEDRRAGTDELKEVEEERKLDREEQRFKERDRRLGKALEENQQVLLLGGASHIASHILKKFLLSVPNSHITLVDFKDPNIAFLNPELRDYKGSSRISTIQASPYDWDWLAEHQSDYNIIIAGSYVHDARYCHNNPIDSIQRNALGAMNFMTALTKGSGWTSDGRLVILSSDKVYGPQEKMPTPETAPLNPVGVRATTRAAQELLMTGLAKSAGIHYIVLRCGTSYGEYTPREKAAYTWCRNLLMGEAIHMYGSFAKNDSPTRDWIHVDDIAALTAFTSIAEWSTSIRDEIYNVGEGASQPHYIWNIAEAMKTVLRRGTPTITDAWREPGEKMLRVWMDSRKAQEKLLLQPSIELIYGIARRLPVWIAHYDLLWSERQIIDLKASLGIRDVAQVRVPKDEGHSGSSAHLGVQA